MTAIPAAQLTLQLEPSLIDRWPSLRQYIEHRTGCQIKSAKQIAADLDIAPSTLSKKLNEVDSNRFTVDNLEQYLDSTGDVLAIIEYLATKFSAGGDEARRARNLARLESLAHTLEREIAKLQEAGAT